MLHLFVNPSTVRAIVALPRDMLPAPPAVTAEDDPQALHSARDSSSSLVDDDGDASVPMLLPGASLRRPAMADKVLMHIAAEMSTVDFRLHLEDGSTLALASVQNLTSDVRMHPAHLAVDLSLGNLRLANHAVPEQNPYHWVCQTRVRTGDESEQSLLNIRFVSSSNMAEPSLEVFTEGYNSSLEVTISQLAIVFQNYFLVELLAWVAALTAALAPPPAPVAAAATTPSSRRAEIERPESTGAAAAAAVPATVMKMVVSLAAPVILMPADTHRGDSLEVDLGYFILTNRVLWDGQPTPPASGAVSGVMVDVSTLTFTGMKVVVITDGINSPNVFDELRDCEVTMCRPLSDPSGALPPIDIAVNIRCVGLSLSNTNYQLLTKYVWLSPSLCNPMP
jgi:hypothetical protein